MDPQAEKYLDKVLEDTSLVLKDLIKEVPRNMDLPPTFLLKFDDGSVHIHVPEPWMLDDKDAYLETTRKAMSELGVVAYVSIIASWVAKAGTSERIKTLQKQGTKIDPNRKEVYILQAGSKKSCKSMVMDVIRDQTGKILEIVEDTTFKNKEFTGRISNLLETSKDKVVN